MTKTPDTLYGFLKYAATLAAGLILFHLVYRNGFSPEKDLPTLAGLLAVFGLGDKLQGVMRRRAARHHDSDDQPEPTD
jgi:hypothetical protein